MERVDRAFPPGSRNFGRVPSVAFRVRRASRAFPRAKRLWIRSPRPLGSLSKAHLKRTAPLSHGPPPYAAYVHKGLTAVQRSCCEMRAQPRAKTHTMHVTHHISFDITRYSRMDDHLHTLDYSDTPSYACVRGRRMSDRSGALPGMSDASRRHRRLTCHQHEAQSRPARRQRPVDATERRCQMARLSARPHAKVDSMARSPTSPTRWPLAYRLPQLARSFTSRCSSSRSRFAGSPPELRDARRPPPASSGAFGPRDQRLPRAVAARVPAACRRSGRRTARGAAESAATLCLPRRRRRQRP